MGENNHHDVIGILINQVAELRGQISAMPTALEGAIDRALERALPERDRRLDEHARRLDKHDERLKIQENLRAGVEAGRGARRRILDAGLLLAAALLTAAATHFLGN